MGDEFKKFHFEKYLKNNLKKILFIFHNYKIFINIFAY